MAWMTQRRIGLLVITVLAVVSIMGTVIIGFVVDRAQCEGAVKAIHNSRTMWEYAIQQNPGPEADDFLAEMNRRLPPGHCEGGKLVIDQPPATVPAPTL
jgi:hypothetical protein